MAGKFIEIDEAARMLGVSVDDVKRMVDRKELPQPLRGSDPPKFRPEEIERAIQDRAAGSGIGDFHPDLMSDSILLSEKELGQSTESASSTIIGKGSPHGPVTDSDIRIAGDPSMSDVTLAADLSGIGSDVRLVLGGSDAKKAGKSDAKKSAMDDDVRLASGGSGAGASDLLRFAEDEIKLADIGGSSKKTSKDNTIKKPGDAKIDDDDDVLSIAPGSDITRGAHDSGIHLVDPKDSGISLEEPLVLGGGSAKELLELGEADVISLDETTDREGATQLKSDDDFLLTPVADTAGDESDSGSQVIALDAEEDSSGVFTPASSGMVAMIEEDTGPGGAVGGSPTGTILASSLVTAPVVPEAPFSGWAVTGLVCCALLLLMTGALMLDIVHNMWHWEGVSPVSSSIFDSIEKTIKWMD